MEHNIKSIVYKISALLILVFAIAYSFIPQVSVWGMVVSVSLFSAITMSTPYPGKSIRGKRLFNFQVIACLLMVVATFLMFKEYNEWPLSFLISAILLLYSSFALPKELEKEKRKEKEKESK